MEESGDRFRDARDALEQVMHADDFPSEAFDRLEVRCTASGEVTWRVWTPRAEEPVGGYIAPA